MNYDIAYCNETTCKKKDVCYRHWGRYEDNVTAGNFWFNDYKQLCVDNGSFAYFIRKEDARWLKGDKS